MSDKLTYCRFCHERHIASETLDNTKTPVGLFCNRKKAMITVFSPIWDGESVYKYIEFNVRTVVDLPALARVNGDKLIGLSRKLAYQISNNAFAKQRKMNYYFVQHIVLDVLRAEKERVGVLR